MSLFVDTHALLWYLTGNKRLSRRAKAALDAAEIILVPAMALAEAVQVIVASRVEGITERQLLNLIRDSERYVIVPLDLHVIEFAQNLPGSLEIHDRLIVATALSQVDKLENIFLVTRDEKITSSGSIPIIW